MSQFKRCYRVLAIPAFGRERDPTPPMGYNNKYEISVGDLILASLNRWRSERPEVFHHDRRPTDANDRLTCGCAVGTQVLGRRGDHYTQRRERYVVFVSSHAVPYTVRIIKYTDAAANPRMSGLCHRDCGIWLVGRWSEPR